MKTEFEKAKSEDSAIRSLWTSDALRGPGKMDLTPQFKAWGAKQVWPFGPEDMEVGEGFHKTDWNWQPGSAMCLMPDGRWYWGSASDRGAHMSIDDDYGFEAKTGREALTLLLIAGAERSVKHSRELLTEAEERLRLNEARLAAITKKKGNV